MAHRPSSINFSDSQEAQFRAFLRGAIRKSPLSRAERDVATTLVNLWFYHRRGGAEFMHPGRTKLAKRARVSVITVARCLAKLRENNVIGVVSHAKGGWGTSTRYTLDPIALLTLCGYEFPKESAGHLVVLERFIVRQFDTHSLAANDTHSGYHDDTRLITADEPSPESDIDFLSRFAGGAA